MHYPGYITRLDKVWGNLSIINHSSAKAELTIRQYLPTLPPFTYHTISFHERWKEREHQSKTKQNNEKGKCTENNRRWDGAAIACTCVVHFHHEHEFAVDSNRVGSSRGSWRIYLDGGWEKVDFTCANIDFLIWCGLRNCELRIAVALLKIEKGKRPWN